MVTQSTPWVAVICVMNPEPLLTQSVGQFSPLTNFVFEEEATINGIIVSAKHDKHHV